MFIEMEANDYFNLPVDMFLDPERFKSKLNEITAYLTALPRITRREAPLLVRRLEKYRVEHITLCDSIPSHYEG